MDYENRGGGAPTDHTVTENQLKHYAGSILENGKKIKGIAMSGFRITIFEFGRNDNQLYYSVWYRGTVKKDNFNEIGGWLKKVTEF